MEKRFYVVHTFTGHEEKVKASIERRADSLGLSDKVGRILVLTEQELRGSKRGRRQMTKHKVYPGYVFVEMELTDETRHLVRNTSGVTGFVGPNREPVPLKEEEVANLLAAADQERPRIRVAWEKGQAIRITSEPFSGIHGIIEEVNPAKENLRVLINIFGRETPVDIDFADVEKLD